MEQTLTNLMPLVITYGTKLIGALLVFLIGKSVARSLTNVLVNMMKKGKIDQTLINFANNGIYTVFFLVVCLMALNTLGVPTTSFLAILGAAGLAIGLALKDSLSNFAAGVMLIIFRPIRVEDLVEVAGTTGVVESIGIFTTTLVTPQNKTVIIANNAVLGGNITNFTVKGTLRIDMTFGIGYDDDLLKAKQTLEDILAKDQRVLKDPAPFVGVSELADNSVNFAVRPHVNVADYWGVFFDTHEKVKLVFDQQNISIPYPQRDVHIYEHSTNGNGVGKVIEKAAVGA